MPSPRKTFADIISDTQVAQRRKMAAKLPEWSVVDGIEIPSKLALEQCSSSATARYKAGVAAGAAEGKTVIDLTGGLGVDSMAFGTVASHVVYNEANADLAAAVGRNFSRLGFGNVELHSLMVDSEEVADGFLGGFKDIGLIYLDPARRDAAGKKVFLLEDCSPNLLELLPALFRHCPEIMVKLSPMADIDMLSSRLGGVLKEVHVVGTGGECKELLCLLSSSHCGPYRIVVADLDRDGIPSLFSFLPSEEASARPRFAPSPEQLCGMDIIVPGAAFLKSGCFNLACSAFGLIKLGRSAQVYAAPAGTAAVPGFRSHRVLEVLPFNNGNVKALGRRFSNCELTARNMPLSSDELRRKMGSQSGGDRHIFAVGCDFSESPSARLLLVTEA